MLAQHTKGLTKKLMCAIITNSHEKAATLFTIANIFKP